MLRLSKLADYGSQIMTLMARDRDVHSASEIADNLGITVATVSKILKMLARQNLVVSVLGAKGGYTLARPSSDISIAEIINAMDGPISITECSNAETSCSRAAACSTRGNWQGINKIILGTLEKMKLSEMIEPKPQVIQMHAMRP